MTVLNRKARQLESQIAQLHRQNNILDKELQEIDRQGMAAHIEKKFHSSQEKFEYQLQKQQEFFEHLNHETRLYQKYLKWMETCDLTPANKGKTSPKSQKKSVHYTEVTRTVEGDLPIDYHLENVKQQVFFIHFVALLIFFRL
jgi:hypothetical protein